jgi:preprotein translocase subunit SecA
MFNSILTKVMGSQNERELKRIGPIVSRVNELEHTIKSLSDAALLAKTDEFRGRLKEGESLDDLLPEAFAVVREASWRTIGLRHYDVQIIGGIVLHSGKISEMKTGEGKTLVSTLPVYLNALEDRGVHLVTVNDYLARRDAEWMGPIYKFLGLSVGAIQHDLSDTERLASYRSDVTYGTNNEFGFDFLRDNMKYSREDCVQRGHHFAIVDEVDSILIDEARTPLIISGPSDESTDKYYKINKIIPKLTRDQDYQVDEKARSVVLLEAGIEKAENALGIGNLYDPKNMELVHHVQQGLKAHTLFKRDVDYMVKESQVVIVDEFTGRLMPGRRYSDGLHQALEAKEEVRIERENQTLATVTFQNYFRMYEKLSGMTGTAETEEAEFGKIYELDVAVVPTNTPLIRTEHQDVIYRTEREKFNAIADEIEEMNKAGRPVLVGTTSIDKSERLGQALKRRGIKHVVLNAKYHEREAEIIAFAGTKHAVTIATNMAGRGTDIILGGNPDFQAKLNLRDRGLQWEENLAEYKTEHDNLRHSWEKIHNEVVQLGGLHILGTERHESRRIDNQLRGRAGRQGDPGSSRFYLSLEDDLMRIFVSERIAGVMQSLGMEEGMPIESRLISRQIERAQKEVEGRNFGIRKHLLEYDDVMNSQRQEIYRFRRELLEGEDQREYILELAREIAVELIDTHAAKDMDPKDWGLEELRINFHRIFAQDLPSNVDELTHGELKDELLKRLQETYKNKEAEIDRLGSGVDTMRWFERNIMLQIIDQQWKDHLLALDHLREGIGLRGYGQRDPLVEYKRESFELFQDLWDRSTEEIVRMIFLLSPVADDSDLQGIPPRPARPLSYSGSASVALPVPNPSGTTPAGIASSVPKVGRNQPCPCGSGKKYKRCHAIER